MTPQDQNDKPDSAGTPAQFKDEAVEGAGIDVIHARIVAREEEEPEEGFERPPWWLWTVSTILLFAMGFYVGRYGGSFSTVAHEVEQPEVAAGWIGVKREVRGDVVYAAVCQTCHQATGLGVAGQYPPLVGSEWLLQDPETPIRIVLRGLEGEITVKGTIYNNKMPAFHDKLSDEEIAAVLTHVRSSWGDAASGITAAEVDTIRHQTTAPEEFGAGRGPWSQAELLALRKKTTL